MNHASKLALALLLLALLGGLGVFLWLRPAHAPAPVEAQSPETHGVEAPRSVPASSNEKLAAESAESERASVQKDAPSAPVESAQAPKLEEATIVARLVDENLRPISDAWLRSTSSFEDEKLDPVQEARSGADGVATLHWKGVMQKYSVLFHAGARGYATLFPRGTIKAGETLHLGDLTLRPGGSVSGRVVDTQQRPVGKCEVVVYDDHTPWGANDLEELRSRGPMLWAGAPRAQSGDDGRFLVEGVPAGMTRAWARSEGMRWAISEPVEVPAGGEARDVVLVLDPEDKNDPELRDIEGIVLDPEDKPVPRARLNVQQTADGSSWSGGSRADEGGRFRVHPEQRGVHISIDFNDAEDRYTGVKLEDVKPGTKNLVIRLEEARTLVLAVRDEHAPVEKFRVRWSSTEWNTHGYVDKEELHADGRAALRMPTRGNFWLQVMAPGHVPGKLGPIDGARPPAELSIALVSVPGIRGRVVAGEKPVPGAKVTLYTQPLDAQIQMNGFTTLVEPDAKVQTTSDAEGRFALDLASDGNFVLFADAEGYARTQFGPAQLAASKGVQDLVLALDAGGVLEGKVLTAPGRSPAGVVVGINRGDARPFTQIAGADGSFRFEHLAPGPWEIRRCEAMFEGPTSTTMSSGDNTKPGEIRSDFVIAAGQTTRHDLDLRDKQPCVLEIELTNNSQPARAWSVIAWSTSMRVINGALPSGSTDSSGRLRLEIEDSGETLLTITPPAESASEFKFRETITLQRGPNNWSHDLRTGRIEGTISGWQPDAGVRWCAGSSETPGSEPLEIRPDALGHFVVPYLPASKVAVKRVRGVGGAQTIEDVQTFDLAAGATKSLQLP